MAKTDETKRIPTYTAEVNQEGHLVIAFPKSGDELVVMPGGFSTAIQAQAMLHGFKQKIIDAGALPFNKEAGRYPTDAEKESAMKEVYDRLLAGQWNAVREGGGNEGGMLARAIADLKSITVADAIEWVKARTADEKKALEGNPKVKALIDGYKAAKVRSDIDSNALLDSIGVEGEGE